MKSEKYKWVGTGGSGKGHAEGGFDTSSSGTGTYAVTYASGSATASGTENKDSHYQWSDKYDETYTYDTAKQAWKTFGSGSGSGDGHGHHDYSASGSFGSATNGGSLSSSGSTDSKWDATWDWDTEGNYQAELNTSGSSLSDSVDKTWSASSSAYTSHYGNTVGTWTNDYSGSTEIHSHSEADYQTKKNWLTDSSGSTWTASSGGSSSSYLEKTTQNSSKYSWDWTLTESNHTKTDVGYSGYGSYDQTKDTWNSGYSGKSSSDGSSALTSTSGGSQAHDWKYHYDSANAWTETWSTGSTSGSTSGSGSGGGYTNTTSGGSSSSWGSSGSSLNSWSSSWSYSTPATVFLSGSGSGVTSGSGAATGGSGAAYGGGTTYSSGGATSGNTSSGNTTYAAASVSTVASTGSATASTVSTANGILTSAAQVAALGVNAAPEGGTPWYSDWTWGGVWGETQDVLSWTLDRVIQLDTGVLDAIWGLPQGVVNFGSWAIGSDYRLGNVSDLQRYFWGDTVADINGSGWVYSTGYIAGTGLVVWATAPIIAAGGAVATGIALGVGVVATGFGLYHVYDNWERMEWSDVYRELGSIIVGWTVGLNVKRLPQPPWFRPIPGPQAPPPIETGPGGETSPPVGDPDPVYVPPADYKPPLPGEPDPVYNPPSDYVPGEPVVLPGRRIAAPAEPTPDVAPPTSISRAVRPNEQAFSLRKGEDGVSVYDADKVTPGDITASGLKGEVKSITPELVQKHGLILEKTPGADNLPPLLRDNHWEISKPEAMSRKAFKDALKALSKELEGGE